jgi:amino acid transporter
MPRHTDLRLSTPLLSRDASDGLGALAPSRVKTSAKLGVFLGVFVPTMNTIYGVVVFLRWGWAVGQAGVLQVMAMVLIGHVIALLTCASVSAICTNGEVGPGGAYYIISRALGPEFGGSIGALFYIAQATGVAFYMLGLAETVLETLPFSPVKMIPFLPDEWGGTCPTHNFPVILPVVLQSSETVACCVEQGLTRAATPNTETQCSSARLPCWWS